MKKMDVLFGSLKVIAVRKKLEGLIQKSNLLFINPNNKMNPLPISVDNNNRKSIK